MAEQKSRICFVVGPIGDTESDVRVHADWILEEIIQPVISQFPNFTVVRADQIAPPGMIDAQVIQHLLDSELVIADLSKENPNAFYEIGIRHMAQKPIIHMQLADEKIPFDVSLYRTMKFSRARPSDLRKAREELKRAVDAVLVDGYQVDNPVTRARGQIKLEERATPEQKLVLEQLRSHQDRLENLEAQAVVYERPKRSLSKRIREPTQRSTTMYVELDPNFPDLSHVTEEVIRLLPRVRWITNVGRFDQHTIQFDAPDTVIGNEEWKELELELQGTRGVLRVSGIPF